MKPLWLLLICTGLYAYCIYIYMNDGLTAASCERVCKSAAPAICNCPHIQLLCIMHAAAIHIKLSCLKMHNACSHDVMAAATNYAHGMCVCVCVRASALSVFVIKRSAECAAITSRVTWLSQSADRQCNWEITHALARTPNNSPTSICACAWEFRAVRSCL